MSKKPQKTEGETIFWLNPTTNKLVISSSPKYTFGWTGWTQREEIFEDEPSDFELWAREIRKEAGIIDPPRKLVFGGGRSTNENFWGYKPSQPGMSLTFTGPTMWEDSDKAAPTEEEFDKD